MADISLLDQSVPDLVKAAANLPLADLRALKAAEEVGKTRKSAIRSLDELIEARTVLEEPVEEPEGGEVLEDPEPLEPTITWENPNVITNCMVDTVLHLGDGRRLAPGESAQVDPELADVLRERGQAE